MHKYNNVAELRHFRGELKRQHRSRRELISLGILGRVRFGKTECRLAHERTVISN
jgi:hypothetical protein